MKIPHDFRASLLLYLLLLSRSPALGQIWIPTGAPSNSWVTVACSADGTKLVAATAIATTNGQTGQIFTSTDAGTNWSLTAAPSTAWKSVVSSADGAKLAAVAQVTTIYRSTNSGATWSVAGMDGQSISCSADGSTLTTANYRSQVYLSTNLASVWNPRNTPMVDVVNALCSVSGGLLAAGNNVGQFSISTNAGVNWSKVSSTGLQAHSLAGSSDLTRLVAISSYGSRYWVVTSTNMGQSWITNNLPASSWSAGASSADGSKLVVVASGGPIYSSTNIGLTWNSNNAPALLWQSVAMTADGSTVFAVASNGGIWVQRTVPKPAVQIALAANSLAFSWIVPSATFKIQETSGLTPPVWTDLTNSVTLNLSNLNDEVFLPHGAGGFYRLQMR